MLHVITLYAVWAFIVDVCDGLQQSSECQGVSYLQVTPMLLQSMTLSQCYSIECTVQPCFSVTVLHF